MSQFVSSQYNMTIPSKSVIAPSMRQQMYHDGDTVRFNIPSFMSNIDSRQSYLKFKVKIKGAPALLTFSKKSGVHSLIRNLRIYDDQTNLLLENIQDYNTLSQLLHIYSENRSIRNRRGLTELLEPGSRTFDGLEYDNLPARNCDQSQLFVSMPTGSDATYSTNETIADRAVECVVALRLYSGVLGSLSSKMFPSFIVGGLRVEIDFATAAECLSLWTAEGICDDTGNPLSTLGDGDSCRFGIIKPEPMNAAPLTEVYLYCEKNPGFDQLTDDDTNNFFPILGAEPLQNGTSIVKNQGVGSANLVVGKNLYGFDNTSGATVLKDLGKITGIQVNAGENAGGVCFVKVGLDGTGADGADFVGGAGNKANGSDKNPDRKSNSCFVKASEVFETTPTIEINDVEFVVKTASPPASYSEALVKQSQSDEGMKLDYMTFDTYRNNINASERVVQINIPATNHRATAILSVPLQNNVAPSVSYNNLNPVIDTASSYNYLVANKLQPTRRVNLGLLSQTPAKTEQVALFECEKALGSCKIMVKQLDHQDTNFFIARALARYGTIYNLAADGNISLRIDYDNPQMNKLMVNYVGGLRRLVVNSSGKFIEP